MRLETDSSLPVVNNDLKRNYLLLISLRCISIEPFQEGNFMAQCSAESARLQARAFARDPIDDSTKGALTQFWELFTMIPCAPKYLKR